MFFIVWEVTFNYANSDKSLLLLLLTLPFKYIILKKKNELSRLLLPDPSFSLPTSTFTITSANAPAKAHRAAQAHTEAGMEEAGHGQLQLFWGLNQCVEDLNLSFFLCDSAILFFF